MNQLTVIEQQQTDLAEYTPTPLEIAGQVANHHARAAVFDDYLSRKSDNTIRTQAAALALFADYLSQAGLTVGDLQRDPEAWRGVTWGIVEGFRNWLLKQGYSVASVNNRLSAVKVYAKLASKAGTVDKLEYLQIKDVNGYAGKEAKRVNERREVTRMGHKKADHVSLTPEQAKTLKTHDLDTPQGRRDALLMCLLLDHGLRVGEVAGLQVSDINLASAELVFYRPKVDKQQTHRLTRDTINAAIAYLKHDALPLAGGLLLGSTKSGELTSSPMSERAITKRVNYLGRARLGLEGLSAHDCRHFWATDAARNGTDPFRLQEAGGWSSLTMPRRYVEAAKVANEGVRLSE